MPVVTLRDATGPCSTASRSSAVLCLGGAASPLSEEAKRCRRTGREERTEDQKGCIRVSRFLCSVRTSLGMLIELDDEEVTMEESESESTDAESSKEDSLSELMRRNWRSSASTSKSSVISVGRGGSLIDDRRSSVDEVNSGSAELPSSFGSAAKPTQASVQRCRRKYHTHTYPLRDG